MKFKFINVRNVCDLVPAWATDPVSLARSLDRIFDSDDGALLVPSGQAVYRKLDFWIVVDLQADEPMIWIRLPDAGVDLSGSFIIKCGSTRQAQTQIEFPLNAIFRDYDDIQGHYLVYVHSIQTDVPLAYVGLTKRRWFDRYAEHTASARAGSPYLFHRALREHTGSPIMHKVFAYELSQEAALRWEEDAVAGYGLYPLGLNMIPGGRAGFAYLSRLGVAARSTEERNSLVEQLAWRESLEGRPNPLCAARWESDPSFAERVICGHSGRLTVQQVDAIRQFASLGQSAEVIADRVGARNRRQVQQVITGATYARVGRPL